MLTKSVTLEYSQDTGCVVDEEREHHLRYKHKQKHNPDREDCEVRLEEYGNKTKEKELEDGIEERI